MYISVIGNLVNPRITNITTGQTMKLETTTDKLVVDNRTKPFKITNNGVNIKTTQKGQYIYLVAGENNIVVSCENYTAEDQADVYIKFSNTYE
jgi:phage-related protein